MHRYIPRYNSLDTFKLFGDGFAILSIHWPIFVQMCRLLKYLVEIGFPWRSFYQFKLILYFVIYLFRFQLFRFCQDKHTKSQLAMFGRQAIGSPGLFYALLHSYSLKRYTSNCRIFLTKYSICASFL